MFSFSKEEEKEVEKDSTRSPLAFTFMKFKADSNAENIETYQRQDADEEDSSSINDVEDSSKAEDDDKEFEKLAR